jgi:FecR protein
MKLQLLVGMSLLLLLCGMAAAQEQPAGPARAPFAGATVTEFKGKVSIQLPGQAFHSPSLNEVLPAETQITTDEGRLLLRLSDGSNLLVRPNTRLVLKQPETSGWRYVQVLFGRVRAEIQKHLGGSPGFQIGTPSAVISVRGTRFDVEVNRQGTTEVDVHEGVVQLDSVKGLGESVLIRAGFSSRVGFESGPESPRPTRDLRPELDRPGHGRDHHSDDSEDDSIKRLRASSDDHHEGSDSRDGSKDSSSSSGSGDQPGSGKDGGEHQHREGGSSPPEF